MRFLLKKVSMFILAGLGLLGVAKKKSTWLLQDKSPEGRPQSKSSLERARIWSRVCLYFRSLPCLGLVSTNALRLIGCEQR
jgi:hypothetical protein